MDLLAPRSGVEGNCSVRGGGGSSLEMCIFIKHVGSSYLHYPTLLSNLVRNWLLGLSTAVEEDN